MLCFSTPRKRPAAATCPSARLPTSATPSVSLQSCSISQAPPTATRSPLNAFLPFLPLSLFLAALLTVHEIPEPSLGPTVRYQVDLEAMCGSLTDPVFKGWLAVGKVYLGEECTGAEYTGDDTFPPVPLFIYGKSNAIPYNPRPVTAPANLPARK